MVKILEVVSFQNSLRIKLRGSTEINIVNPLYVMHTEICKNSEIYCPRENF